MVSCCILTQFFRWGTLNSVIGTNSSLSNLCTSFGGQLNLRSLQMQTVLCEQPCGWITSLIWCDSLASSCCKMFILTACIGVPCHKYGGNRVWLHFLRFRKLLTADHKTLFFFSFPFGVMLDSRCCLPCSSTRSCLYIILWVASITTSHKYQVRRSSDFFQNPLVGNPTSLQFCSNSATYSFELTFLTTDQKGPSKQLVHLTFNQNFKRHLEHTLKIFKQ